jgi:hypothetical protein
MAPHKPDGSFDPTRPFRDWTQIGFFDTANGCNNAVSRTFGPGPGLGGKLGEAAKKYLD